MGRDVCRHRADSPVLSDQPSPQVRGTTKRRHQEATDTGHEVADRRQSSYCAGSPRVSVGGTSAEVGCRRRPVATSELGADGDTTAGRRAAAMKPGTGGTRGNS